jgi:hypothetical protein
MHLPFQDLLALPQLRTASSAFFHRGMLLPLLLLVLVLLLLLLLLLPIWHILLQERGLCGHSVLRCSGLLHSCHIRLPCCTVGLLM